MDIAEFKLQLIEQLNSLGYIKEIEFYSLEEQSFRAKAIVKVHYELRIRFKIFQDILTLSFALLLENERIWGLDKDNRIGWHIHPLENTELHEPIEPKTINEIIVIFDMVCRNLG